MLNFRYANINDREWIDPIFKNSGYLGADFCFGSLFIWQEIYKSKISKDKDFLYRIYDGAETLYAFPVGNGNYSDALEIMIQDAKDRNITFKMFGITEKMKKILDTIMPNKFKFELRRDMSDYIYNSKDLIFLQGKRYHSKRNHISRFKKSYNWEYCDINKDNLDLCEEFFNKWFSLNKDKDIESEKIAVKRALDNYFDLKLIGGYLEVDNQIAAIIIGEEINDEIFDIHFEKALLEYSGAYPAINQEFTKRSLSNYKYINREEDMGIPNLRKAKLSYKPVKLLEKYIGVFK